MLGPNGEKLNIVIEPPSAKEACEKEPKTIKIGSREHRSNQMKYESDIDCPTITHEVLHLLGLCDEYKEEFKGFLVSSDTREIKMTNGEEKPDNENDQFVLAYDCRVTAKNSIMSNHYERWYNVFGGEEFRELGTSSRNKTESSLLNKAQFNAVLYGDYCLSKNKLFNECADLAYRSSIKAGNEDCLKQKRKCMESNILGKNKAEELSRIRETIKSIEYLQEYSLEQEKTMQVKNPHADAQHEDDFHWYDSALQKLREELEIVSAWPD